ncbi:unannotated protein [freshwater metagenome]|uniref:Unannotated protein n=1 Tax=freshwater metagenome TaxID=449393 RepID=A0A6J5YSR3_9ZZZZ
MPQVGQAVCCNFGCWHCGHAARAAAVVFHWLRRERVFERDIFRFGTGTGRPLLSCEISSEIHQGASIP